MEKISATDAARQIVDNYYIDNNVKIESNINHFERQEIILEFSRIVRYFVHLNKEDDIAIQFVEKLTYTYDTLVQKHKDNLENAGLKKIVNTLKNKLEKYR